MTVRIEKIYLKNILNIDKQEIVLNGNVTGIFGPNGLGKSAAIYALKFLNQIVSLVERDTAFVNIDIMNVNRFAAECGFDMLVDGEYHIHYEINFDRNRISKEYIHITADNYLFEDEVTDLPDFSSKIFENKIGNVAIDILKDFILNKLVILNMEKTVASIDYKLWGYKEYETSSLCDITHLPKPALNIIVKVNRVLKALTGFELILEDQGKDYYMLMFKHDDYVVHYSLISVGIRKILTLLFYIIPLVENGDICLCVFNLGSCIYDEVTLTLLNCKHNGQLIFTSNHLNLANKEHGYDVIFVGEHKSLNSAEILEIINTPLNQTEQKVIVNEI